MAIIAGFYIIGRLTGKARWGNLGLGLGIGVLMHILLDLLIWFDGVAILWPIPSWVNFWSGVTPPEWWMNLMMSVEFLFIALYFLSLDWTARKRGTDAGFLGKLRIWTGVMLLLFVVFTILVYTMEKGFMTPYGALYLVALGVAIGVTIRMRDTVEAIVVKKTTNMEVA